MACSPNASPRARRSARSPPAEPRRREPRAPTRREPPRPCHDARVLTAGGTEAEILLDGVRYVLRITRQGKLILTK